MSGAESLPEDPEVFKRLENGELVPFEGEELIGHNVILDPDNNRIIVDSAIPVSLEFDLLANEAVARQRKLWNKTQGQE